MKFNYNEFNEPLLSKKCKEINMSNAFSVSSIMLTPKPEANNARYTIQWRHTSYTVLTLVNLYTYLLYSLVYVQRLKARAFPALAHSIAEL